MDTKKAALDLSRLLGFDALGDADLVDFDFREDAVSARLGAKVGLGEAMAPAKTKRD